MKAFLFLFLNLSLVLGNTAYADRAIHLGGEKDHTARSALVIGNSTYDVSPLKNPANDARDMAAVLRANGFDVILEVNASQRTMERAVRNFGKKLRNGGVGLFYYAGHGIQVRGRNYLVPVGAVIESESDVKYESVDAGLVLGKMEDAGNDLNIVILDACRNNPFARSFRSSEQGLARMDAPKGSLIAYATAPGSVAADGDEGNGIYTKNLIRYIKTPGMTIEQILKKVRVAVVDETSYKQVPWESSSLMGNFYFSPGKAVASVSPSVVKPLPASVQRLDAEEEMWVLVKDSKNAGDIEAFLKAYPNGRFQYHARLLIKKLSKPATARPTADGAAYTLLFADHFSDNMNDWPIEDAKERSMQLENGSYVFSHKRESKAWEVHQEMPLTDKGDFIIELSMRKIDGDDGSQYGLLFGRKDGDNQFYFQIQGNGKYLYGKQVNGEYNNILAWKRSSRINQGNATNRLKVERVGSRLKLYINDYFVDEVPFEPFFGTRMGFRLDQLKTIAFDDLVIKAADGASPGDDFDSFASSYSLLFSDNFSSNFNDWPIEDAKERSMHVRGGSYVFAHKRDTKAWEVHQEMALKDRGDFIIELTTRKIDGDDTSQYGLIFGRKDGDNQFYFQIQGNGKYLYGKQVNGKYNNILAWKPSRHINTGNATNRLKVHRVGNRIMFYINGHYVDEAPFEPFFGTRMGFRLDERKTIAFDDLIIKTAM